MPKLTTKEIAKLIEDLIMKPVEEHDYGMADRIYSYLKGFPRAEQIAVFEDIIGYVKKLKAFPKARLGGRALYKFGLNPPQYMVQIQEVMLSGKDEEGKEKVPRAQRAESILDIILEASPQAKADKAAMDSARNSPTTPVSDTDTSTEDEATIEPEDLEYQDAVEPTAAELEEAYERAKFDYANVIIAMKINCEYLLKKFSADINVDEMKVYTAQIETIYAGVKRALEQIDISLPYEMQNLPIRSENLMLYASKLVELEKVIDNRLMQQVAAPYNPPSKASDPIQNKDIKKPYACATRMVDAIAKFMETLLFIKRKFGALFARNKAKEQNQPDIKEQSMEDKKLVARKNLTLFYEAMRPGMEQDLVMIRDVVSKAANLPTPKN